MTSTLDRGELAHHAGTALGYAKTAALAVAAGPGATGVAVARKGLRSGLKALQERRATARKDKNRGWRPGKKSAVAAGSILAVAVGAAAFAALRRRELPPPADAPPSLGSPSTNGSSAPTAVTPAQNT